MGRARSGAAEGERGLRNRDREIQCFRSWSGKDRHTLPGGSRTVLARRWVMFWVLALTVLCGSAAISYWVYHAQRDELVADASHELRDATVAFTQALNGVFEPALTLGGTVVDSGIRNAPPSQWPTLFFAIATGPVRHFEQMSGAFLGFPDGRFLHVQDLEVAGPKRSSAAARKSRGLYQRIIDTPDINPRGRWRVYDPETGQAKSSPRVTQPYDPRSRGWYQLVAADGKAHWTDVYQFATSGKLGVTYAQPIFNTDGSLWAVLGVDLSLSSLSQTLLTTSSALALFLHHHLAKKYRIHLGIFVAILIFYLYQS